MYGSNFQLSDRSKVLFSQHMWARILEKMSFFSWKISPVILLSILNFGSNFQPSDQSKSFIFTIYVSPNFRKNAIFLIKNQPRDTIFNPNFGVQFLAFSAWIFWMKALFSWKISSVILLSIPNFGSNFQAS